MKTVLDVVIAFKGACDYMSAYEFIFLGRDGEFIVDGEANAMQRNQKMFVCTGDKVSALVDELASNFGKCDISYQKHCSNEVTRLEGDEMKTVTHEGKAYQIGATYEFTDSDKGRHWELGILNDYASDEEGVGFQSKTGNRTEWFKHIRLQQAPIGTITEAPVELIDGECYQFDHIDAIWDKPVKGIYCEESNSFTLALSTILTRIAVNIKPLTVA